MSFVKPQTSRLSLPLHPIARFAAILTLGLQLSACHLPNWQTGQIRVATRFASHEVQSQSLRIQAIPSESSAIAVAVFKTGSQGKPEQSVLLTPEHASHELGQLEPGPRRVLALAFDSSGNLLAGSSGQAQVIAGQTSQLSLELNQSFSPDAQELAQLKALLPKPTGTLTGSQTSQQTSNSNASPTSQTSNTSNPTPKPAPGTSPSPANLPPKPGTLTPIDASSGQIRDTAGTILDPAAHTVETVIDQVNATVGNVSGTVNNTSGAVTGAVNETADTVTDTVDQIGDSVGGTVGEVVDSTTDTVDDTVDNTVNVVDDTVDAVASAVPSIIPSLIPSILPTPNPTPTPTAAPTATPRPSPTPLLGIKLPLGL